MKNSDTHIYLYAKGHYEITDTISDLRIIVGERCCIFPEDVRIVDIYNLLTRMAFQHIIDSYNTMHFLGEFLDDINPKNMWRVITKQEDKNYDFTMAVIEKSLSVIRHVKVKDGDKILLELDEPDRNILPLKKRENEDNNNV